MSNTASTKVVSTLPPHLSGASPTTYFLNNMVWQNIVETGKQIHAQKKQGIVEFAEQILEPITLLNEDQSGYNELHQACFFEGAERMVESVDYDKVDARDHCGKTPIMWAASNGNEKLVELLIDQGAALNMQNFVGETALYLAAARGFDGICTLLIENGADTRFATIEGSSPVHVAAAGGHIAALKTLVSHGAFINSVDEEGDTPLHYAVRERQTEVIEFLVKYCGADFGLKNEDLESPLDLAQDLGEKSIVSFLSGCFNKHAVTELPEHHLYFGEENNEMQVVRSELPLPNQTNGLGRSVASY